MWASNIFLLNLPKLQFLSNRMKENYSWCLCGENMIWVKFVTTSICTNESNKQFQVVFVCLFSVFFFAFSYCGEQGNEKLEKVLFMRTVLQITASQRIREVELFEKYVETIYNSKDVRNHLKCKRCHKQFIIWKMPQSTYNSRDVRNHL